MCPQGQLMRINRRVGGRVIQAESKLSQVESGGILNNDNNEHLQTKKRI